MPLRVLCHCFPSCAATEGAEQDEDEEDGEDRMEAHSAVRALEPPAPQEAGKRKSGKKSGKSKKQQSADFDEKLLTTIEVSAVLSRPRLSPLVSVAV
jgi:hypothetical protein